MFAASPVIAGDDPPTQQPAQVEIRMGPGSATVVQQFISLPVGNWTPEAIQQHPADYLTACERETKVALQKLQVSEISIAQHKTKLEDQRDELVEKLDFGAKDLEKLKAAYAAALPTGAFPLQWEDYQLDKDQTEIQIVKLDAEIKDYTQLLRNLRAGVDDLQYQKEKLYAARAQAQSQLAKIVVNRETLKIKGITTELKEKMLEIKSINNLLSLGGVGADRSQPATFDSLTTYHRSGVDKAKLRAIMKTRGPVEPAEPVEEAIKPPVEPLVLPAPSGLPTLQQQPAATPIICGMQLPEPPVVVASSKDLLKEEFRSKFATLSGRREGGVVDEVKLYSLLGHPNRTQTVDLKSYWYWVCKDGKMQLVIHGYKNTATEAKNGKGQLVVDQVNDY
jgi:hypothetical protein